MALEGNLTAFGLSEILQLIAVQQKSGMLSVTSGERNKVLFFKDGQVMSTRDRRRKTRDPLRDYLTRYGILSREELSRVGQIANQSKLDMTDVIISERVLDNETLYIHHRAHIQEEVHDVLTWEQCSYKFIPGDDVIRGIKNLGEFNIEGMLMESMRRIDEFPSMLEMFPELAIRVKLSKQPQDDDKLSTNGRTVAALLNKEKSLGDIIASGKMPQFEVYEALKHLVDKELLDISVPRQPENEAGDISAPKRAKKRRGNPLPVMLSFVLFLAALGWGGHTAYPQVRALIFPVSGGPEDPSISRHRMESAIRWKLEAYRASNGTYPPNLERLGAEGFANPAFLRRVEHQQFRYHLTAGGSGYTLL